MSKKVIVNIAFIFFTLLDVFIILNLNWYVKIINYTFKKSIDISSSLYMLICLIIALISFLIFVSIKLVIENEKDEIKGIKLKLEDGTYGTANWMNDKEIEKVLGVIDYEEYRT